MTKTRHPFGATFVMTLALSWTMVTIAIAMAMWRDRSDSLLRVASWVSLWLFTVPVPTLNALTVHRAVAEYDDRAGDAGAQEALIRLRPYLLLCANMALLSAFALIFRR